MRWFAAAVGLTAGVYLSYAAVTWLRYGHAAQPHADDRDQLLDRFMPSYDVVERHRVLVAAPADMTLAAAREQDLFRAPLVAAIIKGRELILGASPSAEPRPQGLLAEVQSMGWVVLAEIPGRELVVGAVTRPWEANPAFRSVDAGEFARFAEPDYVKIAWTLRADPMGADSSIFRTETRAIATDASARTQFRRYWTFLSPGISLIRWSSLGPVKADAERRARSAHATAGAGTPPRGAAGVSR